MTKEIPSRIAKNNVADIFINRWSPRSYSTKPVEKEKLMTLFEAARWTPSSYNDQPWMFVYADNENDIKPFQDLLVPQNQEWANNAPVLAVVFARKRFIYNDEDNFWANFDTGAAWMSLALQASLLDLYAHGMAGFDRDNACKVLGVPEDDFAPIAAIAIGYIEEKSETPSDRRPTESFIHEGKYKPKQ